MKAGNIVITQFRDELLSPCSVDLTLFPEGKTYKKKWNYFDIDCLPQWVKDSVEYQSHNLNYRSKMGDRYGYPSPLDCKKPNLTEDFTIPEEGYVLTPGRIYLAACNERIALGPNVRAKIEGKSSLGRLGIKTHITAGFIDPGFEGSLVLELEVTEPVIIYPNMPVCQLEFDYVTGTVLRPYNKRTTSKYMNQRGAQESRMHLNFEKDGSA
jgi:dCTP deaminase